jgi:hypothetical protein
MAELDRAAEILPQQNVGFRQYGCVHARFRRMGLESIPLALTDHGIAFSAALGKIKSRLDGAKAIGVRCVIHRYTTTEEMRDAVVRDRNGEPYHHHLDE